MRAALLDIDPENDVEVTTTDGVVRIRAHREQKTEQKERRGYRSESRYGEFEREIALPQGVTAQDVKATTRMASSKSESPARTRPRASRLRMPVVRA